MTQHATNNIYIDFLIWNNLPPNVMPFTELCKSILANAFYTSEMEKPKSDCSLSEKRRCNLSYIFVQHSHINIDPTLFSWKRCIYISFLGMVC